MRGKVRLTAAKGRALGIIPAGAGKRAKKVLAPAPATDHPRGCGEKGGRGVLQGGVFGSSPRVRGKRGGCVSVGLYGGSSPRVRGKAPGKSRGQRPSRIIPAGAGKRTPPRHTRPAPWDHPRGCGEKAPQASAGVRRAGSSPRVRGKEVPVVDALCGLRIIPAGAGKSGDPQRRRGRWQDHPRGCGEKCGSPSVGFGLRGSSPRVRGKVESAAARSALMGIIPAGAGKRSRPRARQAQGRDHPRGCGEKRQAARGRRGHLGSSPRVRGKEPASCNSRRSNRIIPAGAGKSCGPLFLFWGGWDHPRGCGEKMIALSATIWGLGSSPRVRGKVVGQRLEESEVGIIPAGAGKSRAAGAVLAGRWDHPRGCGEKVPKRSVLALTRGSSPRVRGKARISVEEVRRRRIIPAGAGKRPCHRPSTLR